MHGDRLTAKPHRIMGLEQSLIYQAYKKP